MRACYDGLLSAAAASANSAYGSTFPYVCLLVSSHLFLGAETLNIAILVVVYVGSGLCYLAC